MSARQQQVPDTLGFCSAGFKVCCCPVHSLQLEISPEMNLSSRQVKQVSCATPLAVRIVSAGSVKAKSGGGACPQAVARRHITRSHATKTARATATALSLSLSLSLIVAQAFEFAASIVGALNSSASSASSASLAKLIFHNIRCLQSLLLPTRRRSLSPAKLFRPPGLA